MLLLNQMIKLYNYTDPHTELDSLISTQSDNPGISTGLDIFLNRKDNPSVCREQKLIP